MSLLPRLSVVIPTWNRAHLVCDAVESALAQGPQVEVIVVNDGSTDETHKVLTRRFGSRIRLLRTPSRLGVGAARNAGVRVATGELLAFLDSDDVWLSKKQDAELQLLERFPQADGVVSDSVSFVDGQRSETTCFAGNGLLTACRGEARWVSECPWLWTNSKNGVAISSITLRRSALASFGKSLFAEDLICCEDWEFQMRVFHRYRIVVSPEVLACVRRFDDGSRPGRAMPGKPRNADQELVLLRDRLAVMKRSHWLSELDAALASELERFRNETEGELARLTASAS